MLYLVLMLPFKLHPVVFYLEVIEVYPAAAVAYQRPLSAVPIGIEPLADGLVSVVDAPYFPLVRRAVYRGGAALALGYVGPAGLIGALVAVPFVKAVLRLKYHVRKRHAGQEQHCRRKQRAKDPFHIIRTSLKYQLYHKPRPKGEGVHAQGKKHGAGYFGGAPFVGVPLRQHS